MFMCRRSVRPLSAGIWGGYHDLYKCTNVLILADVFETFRKTSIQENGLYPAYRHTSPGLSQETRVELKLLTDHDQYLFIKKGM